jgi:hypothetical protein
VRRKREKECEDQTSSTGLVMGDAKEKGEWRREGARRGVRELGKGKKGERVKRERTRLQDGRCDRREGGKEREKEREGEARKGGKREREMDERGK